MIKHVVFFKLNNKFQGEDKIKELQRIKNELETLPSKLSQIKGFEVGIDQLGKLNSYDIALYSTFNSFEDLEIYAKHPEHLKVVESISSSFSQRAVVDYKI